MANKTFNPLQLSSKFAICGLPIRADTYKTCNHGCIYCFADCRKICEFKKDLKVANLKSLEKKLKAVQDGKIKSMIDVLLKEDYDIHCGALSDPFQPVEKELKVTSSMIDICNKYNKHILFSTKGFSVYDANIRPDLHTFQLSVTNVDNRKDLEPGVADIQKRLEFFKKLKSEGFKVGIRIQPFIPNITTLEVVKMFEGADHFTLEGLKLVPQNKEHKEAVLKVTGLKKEDFKQMGLLNLKPEIRLEAYKPFIEYFEKNNISYSIADNDLHYMGNNNCCCGDVLVHKATTFNTTAMFKKYGLNYTLNDIKCECENCNVWDCKCNQLFTSNRQEGCKTVGEFYEKRFDRKSAIFSPKFSYFPVDDE